MMHKGQTVQPAESSASCSGGSREFLTGDELLSKPQVAPAAWTPLSPLTHTAAFFFLLVSQGSPWTGALSMWHFGRANQDRQLHNGPQPSSTSGEYLLLAS